MVWLHLLQDRDSIPNWYTIIHPKALHTHIETQWPTACLWHFMLLILPGIKAAWRGLARFSMSTISSSSSWVRSNEAEWLEAITWKTFGGGGVQGFLRGRWTSMGGEVQNCTGVVNLRPQTQPPADSGSSLLQELEAVVLPPELLTYSLKL